MQGEKTVASHYGVIASHLQSFTRKASLVTLRVDEENIYLNKL